MKFPRLAAWLHCQLMARVADRRPPDFIVGSESIEGAYLLRWFLTPWRRSQTRWRKRATRYPTTWNRIRAGAINALPNLYLHCFLRDDDDRALHDHPSWAVSFMLANGYREHTIAEGGIHQRRVYFAGSLRFLPTKHVHRIELLPAWWMAADMDAAFDRYATSPTEQARCWTLFLFGPTLREWGFHCPEKGWVPWQQFTAAGKPGEIGPGCGE